MSDFAAARRAMVDCQLRTFDVSDRAVLAAFDVVPREIFVREVDRGLAYTDSRLHVGPPPGRALLTPMVLARLLRDAGVGLDESILDVAGGTGYSAAILSQLGGHVTALEESDAIADAARRCIQAGGFADLDVAVGRLDGGHMRNAPFKVIVVNGAMERDPEALLSQLAIGGRLVGFHHQGKLCRAVLYLRTDNQVSRRFLFEAGAPRLAAFDATPSFAF